MSSGPLNTKPGPRFCTQHSTNVSAASLAPQGGWRGGTEGHRACLTLSHPLWACCLDSPRNRFALFCGNKQISWRGFLGELGAGEGKPQDLGEQEPRRNRPGQSQKLGWRLWAEGELRPGSPSPSFRTAEGKPGPWTGPGASSPPLLTCRKTGPAGLCQQQEGDPRIQPGCRGTWKISTALLQLRVHMGRGH